MRGPLRDRLVIVWLILIAATLLSASIGGGDGVISPGRRAAATQVVLIIAFGKVAAVVFNYMDIRRAPRALKILWGAWLAGVLTVLTGIYRASV
jgi:Prokaryotic Cytochrome C oxidase subunit IV